jgi:NAD(P)-dependent dehydrogenase (short-subunit alcohol dehydrogenase family)
MTPQMKASLPAEFREQMLKGTRHARLGEPSDIASMVAFVLSDEGAWIQGQSLGVNGGASFF